MGMAAGQARLLSITSRMSDNELRAQIINNNKMRLATESSQVSESYVQALNEAQLMFTNYDKDNNASYQALTFNALTQYNPYNNQYALFNSAGNILVSESDAKKFKAANGDLNTFLKSYGLENTTTYWSNLKAHYDEKAGGISYKTGLTDNDGNEILGYVTGDDADTIIKSLQEIYEGDGTSIHPGYLNAKSSETYNKYTTAVDTYIDKRDNYLAVIAENMKAIYENTMKGNGKSPAELLEAAKGFDPSNANINDVSKWLNNIDSLIGTSGTSKTATGMYKYTTNGTSETFDALKKLITDNKGVLKTENFDCSFDNDNKLIINGSDNETYTLAYDKINNQYTITINDGTSAPSTTDRFRTDSNGNLLIDLTLGSNNDTLTGITPIPTSQLPSSDAAWADNQLQLTIPKEILDYLKNTSGNKPTGTVEVKSKNDTENMISIGKTVLNSLAQVIYNEWDPEHGNYGTFGPGSQTAINAITAIVDKMGLSGQAKKDKIEELKQKQQLAQGEFNLAVKALCQIVFGKDTPPTGFSIMKLDDIEETHKALNQAPYNTQTTTDDVGNTVTLQQNFEKIYDVYVLDCIQNTYGEPSYAWIDTSNTNGDPSSLNENGQAKKVWYENLFLRMQQSGYQALLDGLASSKEWIQFAFNSGIVSMEQIDAYNNWNPIIYTNCSDITEQTNNAAIAKAEAEYNSAMNKIENKDKRYDLELKNIDTEHNSLQTEYDSIKGAVDKNIERTFKMYS